MKQIGLMLAFLSVISCGGKSKPQKPGANDSIPTDTGTYSAPYSTDSLRGEYMGSFGKGTIIISVSYINGNHASGYNIVKGNRRNIKGSVTNKGSYFEFNLSEPGGEPTDGNFSFSIDTATKTLKGSWTPNDTTKVKPKDFELVKRTFDRNELAGFVGKWYMNELSVEFKKDKSGLAEGYWYNEKTETSEEIKIPFSWFEEKKSVSIEWSKNPIFPSSTMKFKYEKNQYDEMLQSGNYTMYRY
jgi:hypothetical protein